MTCDYHVAAPFQTVSVGKRIRYTMINFPTSANMKYYILPSRNAFFLFCDSLVLGMLCLCSTRSKTSSNQFPKQQENYILGKNTNKQHLFLILNLG